MTPYDFLQLTLLAADREIRGRTKLQKTVYFLGILTGELPKLGFRPHYYGPYSDVVAAQLNRLKSIGFVSETSHGFGSVGAEGFEIARHDFKLTEEGRQIAEEKKRNNPDVWRKIKGAMDRLNEAGEIDYMRMSVAAKAYFMLMQNGQALTAEELSKSARSFGWQASPERDRKSFQFS